MSSTPTHTCLNCKIDISSTKEFNIHGYKGHCIVISNDYFKDVQKLETQKITNCSKIRCSSCGTFGNLGYQCRDCDMRICDNGCLIVHRNHYIVHLETYNTDVLNYNRQLQLKLDSITYKCDLIFGNSENILNHQNYYSEYDNISKNPPENPEALKYKNEINKVFHMFSHNSYEKKRKMTPSIKKIRQKVMDPENHLCVKKQITFNEHFRNMSDLFFSKTGLLNDNDIMNIATKINAIPVCQLKMKQITNIPIQYKDMDPSAILRILKKLNKEHIIYIYDALHEKSFNELEDKDNIDIIKKIKGKLLMKCYKK